DVRPAGAHEPGEPEHLAPPQVERNAGELARAAEVAHAQDHLTGVVVVAGVEVGHLAPDHGGDEPGPGDVVAGIGRDVAAVAKHRDAVGYLEHLAPPGAG